MFLNQFLSALKVMIRQKSVVIWLFIFPLALATIFYFAFVGFSSESYVLDESKIVVEGIENNPMFEQVLNEVSNLDGKSGENDLFEIVTLKENEDAKKLLADGDIDAILSVEKDNIKITVASSNKTSSIAKVFVDNYLASESTIKNILAENNYNMAILPSIINDLLMADIPEVENVEVSKNKVDLAGSYFFALLAMTCMYFGMAGHEIVENIQASRAPLAQRMLVSPTNRIKILLANYLAVLLVGVITVLVYLLYTSYVLGINYGEGNFFLVWLTGVIGVIVAVNFGLFLGALIKNKGAREGLILGTTMLFSLFSGLYSHEAKSIFLQKMPFINYINPVGLITDSVYALFMYDTFTPYLIRMGILLAFGIVFLVGTMLLIRRKKYASV